MLHFALITLAFTAVVCDPTPAELNAALAKDVQAWQQSLDPPGRFFGGSLGFSNLDERVDLWTTSVGLMNINSNLNLVENATYTPVNKTVTAHMRTTPDFNAQASVEMPTRMPIVSLDGMLDVFWTFTVAIGDNSTVDVNVLNVWPGNDTTMAMVGGGFGKKRRAQLTQEFVDALADPASTNSLLFNRFNNYYQDNLLINLNNTIPVLLNHQ